MDWFKKIQRWHEQGLWSDAMVQNAVKKGKLTQEEADKILAGGDPA